MPASFHKLIRDFLKDWKDPEAIQEMILRLTLADNARSAQLRRMAEMHYGSLADPSNQSAFLSDCIVDLRNRREALLNQPYINVTFLILLFRNAMIDRIRLDRKQSDRFVFLDAESDTGDGPAHCSGSAVDMEATYIVDVAGLELVEIFQSALSQGEKVTLCDYLARSHGDKGKTGFLDDVSEPARFKRVSRLKQRLADLNRPGTDYTPYSDPEIWRAAFTRFQSEICPGLRLDRMESKTERSS